MSLLQNIIVREDLKDLYEEVYDALSSVEAMVADGEILSYDEKELDYALGEYYPQYGRCYESACAYLDAIEKQLKNYGN